MSVDRGRTLLVFYSYPVEASLTALFRGIEVCSPSKIIIASSRRRSDEVAKLVEILGDVLGIEVVPYPLLPDVETSPMEVARFVDHVRNMLGHVDGDLCLISSAGSRLELVSTAMVVDRSRTHVLYTSFLWGPWKGLFYPYTPRPLQLVHEIHSYGGLPHYTGIDFVNRLREASNRLLPKLTRLRREVARVQLYLNSLTPTPCYATRDSVECSCRGLSIRILHGASLRAEARIDDYCSWSDVVDAVDDLVKQIEDLESRVPEDVYRALRLVSNVAGLSLAVVEECSFGCQDLENVLLLDALAKLGRVALIDTNTVYFGLHTQLYEVEEARKLIEVPLCLYVELYQHQAQYERAYHRLRSSIAALLTEELNQWRLPVNSLAAYKPCEVGLAVASNRNSIAVTGDRHAYERLLKLLGIDSIKIRTAPINQVKFLHNEHSRRISYAYHALAQLKAITERARKDLQALGIVIEITTY